MSGPYRRRSSGRGFTLLEVLLATVLSAVLLMTLWSLFGMYGRLLEQGQTKVTRAQLVRGVTQQLVDDLRGAIQDVADPALQSTGPARRFGLFGTSQSLQVDVMHAAGEGLSRPTSEDLAAPTDEQALGSEAWELRTVRYGFEAHQFDEAGALANRGGLVRQELDFQTPGATVAGGAAGPEAAGQGEEPAADADESQTGLGPLDIAAAAEDPHSTWVPEVAAVEFRYFDGFSWTGSWNSLAQKSLPVAVEMTIRIQTPEEIARQQNQEPVLGEDGAELLEPGQAAPAAPGSVYRVVVDLPGASLHRATRAVGAIGSELLDGLDMPELDQPVGEDAVEMPEELLDDEGNPIPVIQLPTGAPPGGNSRGQVRHGPRYVPPPPDLENRMFPGADRPIRVLP